MKKTALHIPLVVVSLVALLSSRSWAAPPKNGQFEKPSTLSASSVLPAHLLKGPYHTVKEKVISDGYFNSYTIESQFGIFEVEGYALLETRVGELVALAELDKLSSSSVFADAAYKAGKGIVLAPVNIVKKTAKHVSDPQKMKETIAAVPEGAERLFSWVYRQGKRGVNAIGDAFSSSESEETSANKKDEKKKSTGEAVADTVDQGASFGLKFIGYTKRQREWFRKLKVNPYTSNETLRDEIMRVAGIETAVGTAFRFVPGLGLLGELSTFNTWYERAEKLSLYEDPDTIGKKNQKELLELGVPEDLITEFLQNKAYSPWTRRFISASLTALGPNVKGHEAFIRAANQAKNEPSALYFVSIAEALEKRHQKTPLVRLVASTHLPGAITKDKTLYIPLSVDYLFWTEQVAQIFKDFRAQIPKDPPYTKIQVTIRGKATPRARQALEALGAAVSVGNL
jgi:hypothetical protein